MIRIRTRAEVRARLVNVPLALESSRAELILEALAERNDPAALHALAVVDDPDAPALPYANRAGVAVIPIQGPLLQRGDWLTDLFGIATYDGIRSAYLAALGAPDIRAVVLDIDSPGGLVSGCFDLADTIAAGRVIKPTWSILSEMACSAAYALASATDRICIPQTGIAGSIGVIGMHVDVSRLLDEAGITVTVLQYGDRKADGSPYAPLSDPSRARLQGDIDAMGEIFVATVARNRSIPIAAVRAQQATTFLGSAAVEAGLADLVASPDAAFRALLATLT